MSLKEPLATEIKLKYPRQENRLWIEGPNWCIYHLLFDMIFECFGTKVNIGRRRMKLIPLTRESECQHSV